MNLDTTIDIDIKGFFQWWGRELAFLLPETLKRKLRDYQGRLIFTPLSAGFQVEWFDGDDKLIVRQRIDSSGFYQRLKQQYPACEKAERVLRLPADQALQKVIFLPVAAQENLAQVVSFELDRYTPFKADQVYFSLITLGNTGYGQIQVLLIVVPKTQLDEQLQSLQALLDVKPHRVDYELTARDYVQFRNAYNLLPASYRQQRSKFSQSAHWLLGSLLVVLMLAVLVGPVWMEAQSVETLKAHLKQLEKQNRMVNAQQAEIDALHAETQKLIDVKRQAPSLLAVLSELTRLLDDETWLTHLQFSDQHMQIQGQSPAASALIGVLEHSDFFSNVSFVSPLTQDKVTGRERFQISMDINMPVSLDETATNDTPEQPSEEQDPEAEPLPEETNVEMLDEGDAD